MTEYPLTTTERVAMGALLSREQAIRAQMDEVGAEIRARLGIDKERKASLDMARGVLRVEEGPAT